MLLSAGTFRINTSISLPSNVVLRGAGADQTILSPYGNSTAVIATAASEPSAGNAVNITGGSTAGSQSIVVSSATNFSVGGYALITETNDPAYVSSTGSAGLCSWCDPPYNDNGNRARGQIVEVTSKVGTSIGIAPGLYSAYSRTPQAIPFAAGRKYAGVESLQIYANNTGYSYNVLFDGCAYCWVKGIEGNYVDGNGDHVGIQFGYRDEVRDSYFSSAYVHSNGSTEDEVQLSFKSSGCLIENNILERLQTAVNIGNGSAGNVVAYNLMTGGFDQGTRNLASVGMLYTHGAHPQFNLAEGNVMPEVYTDAVWGTSSEFTSFRNWATGTSMTCNPLSGRATVSCTGVNGNWQTQTSRAMQIDGLLTKANFVGNVVGSAQQTALSISKVASLQWPASRSYDTAAYGWTWGYTSTGDSGSNSLDNTNAYTTAFLHGNYNNIDASLVWATGVTHTLPASFVHSTKPAWFGNNSWPAIGPEVTAGSGPGGHTMVIPAQACYASMGGTEGGAGSPLKFNANNCYYAASGDPPLSPTGLSATAQ